MPLKAFFAEVFQAVKVFHGSRNGQKMAKDVEIEGGEWRPRKI